MSRRLVLSASTALAAAALIVGCGAMGPSGGNPMSFFITSTNPGKGGDLGGLAGADRYCQSLAASVGAGNKTWRAYLSNAALNGQPAINARDRIGNGPWPNAKGVVIATSVADLHSANAKVGKDTSLTEKGEVVSGFGDEVNRHDILTGSRPDGTLAVPEPGKDTTCGNWTKSDGGSAIVGHHDHKGTNPDPVANASWNSSHGTRGCSVDQLKQSGSAGLMYCFATN
ncbi:MULTISPECIES: hypothetical protein [Comamonas]|uniref:Lectin n=1 Tax=Comamonas testosteroni TaxID=285 RepID=A0A096GZ41_COMTE|nr:MULTISPECIES: hypothetical protein [Comamonas]KGH30440.1 hypothetical protein P353_09825 [Comamonas testosteroni]MPT10890.1 hypothetical protein [Comamonas sp.]